MANASTIRLFRERLRRGAVGGAVEVSIVWLLQHLAVLRFFPSRPAVSALSMYSVASGTLQEVSPTWTVTLPIFLAVALGWAETLGATDLFVGVNAVDYSGYPDCRPEFIKAFAELANLATQVGVEGTGQFEVHSPLIAMTKAEIISTGITLGVDYGLTHSCYDPDLKGRSCGRCDSCRVRLKGFAEAGTEDPASYQ